MKFYINTLIFIIALVIANCGVSNADPVNINITGNIIASPCTVKEATGINVGLGDIQVGGLWASGARSGLKDFPIDLINCPEGTDSVQVIFSGEEDSSQPTHYASSGTARNVDVRLVEKKTGFDKYNGSTITLPVLNDRSVTYEMQSEVFSHGEPTPGTVNAVILATFIYQ